MSVFAYFGLLVLVPIFAAKGSKFARFHANQVLVLWLGIINALNGRAKELPVIGRFAVLK